jgi:hypothetical protein
LVNLKPISYAAIIYGIAFDLGKLIVDASANLPNLNNVTGYEVRNAAIGAMFIRENAKTTTTLK